MTKPRDTILVVDDEAPVRQILRMLLQSEGFAVDEAEDGATCLHHVYRHRPDLILLDIRLPGRDGREVCRLLREIDPQLPIMMLTALSEEREKVERLTDGADDYLTKPFHNEELVARVRALLRRARQSSRDHAHSYRDSAIDVDFDSRQLMVGGHHVTLSPKQWRLLECLVTRKDQVVSSEELLRYAWGLGYEAESKYLKVFISHLRQKLGDNPKRPHYIHTAREHGYYFASHS